MAGRPTAMGGEVYRTLVEALRRGAWDWVAAEAAGINRRTFYRWMARGEGGEEPFAEFAREVRRAKAQARLGAEAQVREQNPLAWLRLGPGRERSGEPGWTGAVRAQGRPAEAEAGEGELDPEVERIFQAVLADPELQGLIEQRGASGEGGGPLPGRGWVGPGAREG